MNFMKYRKFYYAFSILLTVVGILFLVMNKGLNRGIDFTGGTAMTLQMADPVTQEQLRVKLAEIGHPSAIVQNFGNNTYFVRTVQIDDPAQNALVDSLKTSLSPNGIEVLATELVSPVVAWDTIRNAGIAVAASAVLIFFYLWWAFRKMPNPARYGAAAIVALAHDIFIVIGIFALLGFLFDTEVNTMFLIALLTVLGYSVNDTIVVFDRIRENVLNHTNRTLTENANNAITETIGRSINTGMALMFTIAALLLFGGPTIREFLLVLLIGVLAGTYSSPGIATPLLIDWENWRKSRAAKRETARAQQPATA